MQPIVPHVAALAVAALFYLWRSHQQARQRDGIRRQRVAYMLWVMADHVEAADPTLSPRGV